MTVKNVFTDPVTGDGYTWHHNHGWDGDERNGVQNAATWSAATGGTMLPQFGEAQADLWTLRGTILRRAQHEAFLTWAAISREQTIYFTDFDEVTYEVVIQHYSWQRVGVGRNPQDADMSYNIFRYTLELLVLGVIEDEP